MAANMNLKNCLIAGMLLLLCVDAQAQRRRHRKEMPKPKPVPQKVLANRSDTTIRGATLEVYQQYEPELKPVSKPEFSATLPPKPAAPTAQSYDVPQQTLVYSYRSLPLRPLALGKDSVLPDAANYALFGGGNFSTILAEVGLGGFHGRQWQSALQARYLTQKGNIEGQIFRSLQLKADGTATLKNHLLDGGFDVQSDAFGAYGYNHDLVSHSLSEVKRVSTNISLHAGAVNETPGPWGISYHPTVSANYFTATMLSHETNFQIALPAEKKIDKKFSAGIGVHAWITNTAGDSLSRSNNVLQFTPHIAYKLDDFSSYIGLNPTIGKDVTYLLPDILLRYNFSKSKFAISAGWNGSLLQNTAQQLFAANPFLAGISMLNLKQTRTDDVFGKLELGLGNHLSIWVRGGWKQFKNLPLFINQVAGDGKDFELINDPMVQAISWGGGVNYTIGKSLSLGASGNWNNFYKKTYGHVFGEPSIQLRGDIAWMPLPALQFTGYLEVMDQIWGINKLGISEKTNSVVDAGLAAEYSFIRQLNGFIRVDNLLGRKNERWLNYPSFGFNIYGGIRFLF